MHESQPMYDVLRDELLFGQHEDVQLQQYLKVKQMIAMTLDLH
jgi:hypothetical protein